MGGRQALGPTTRFLEMQADCIISPQQLGTMVRAPLAKENGGANNMINAAPSKIPNENNILVIPTHFVVLRHKPQYKTLEVAPISTHR